MPSPHATGQDSLVKGLFRDRQLAERAFHAAQQLGYAPTDINAIMSDETRETMAATAGRSDLARKAVDKDEPIAKEVGGPASATVATIAPALAAVGTVLLIPGIIAAGPIAVALAAAGTMGVGAGLIGALAEWGIPSEQVDEYEAGIRDGGILLAIKPRTAADRQKLIESWKAIGGESVHS
jgi:hypothetical protein